MVALVPTILGLIFCDMLRVGLHGKYMKTVWLSYKEQIYAKYSSGRFNMGEYYNQTWAFEVFHNQYWENPQYNKQVGMMTGWGGVGG